MSIRHSPWERDDVSSILTTPTNLRGRSLDGQSTGMPRRVRGFDSRRPLPITRAVSSLPHFHIYEQARVAKRFKASGCKPENRRFESDRALFPLDRRTCKDCGRAAHPARLKPHAARNPRRKAEG